MPDLLALPWRTCGQHGLAVLAVVGDGRYALVGMMATAEVAALVCEAHNASLALYPLAPDARLCDAQSMSDHETFLALLRWRTGRRQARAIYAQYSAEPADSDVLIGLMDTPDLAAEAVFAHNALLAVRPLPDGQEVHGGG